MARYEFAHYWQLTDFNVQETKEQRILTFSVVRWCEFQDYQNFKQKNSFSYLKLV